MKIRGSSKDISRNGRFLQGNNRPLPRISRFLKGRNRSLGRYLNFYKNKCVKGIFFYSFIIFTFPTPPLSPVWTFLGLKKGAQKVRVYFFLFFKMFLFREIFGYIHTIFLFLALSHACYTPLIYFWMNVQVKYNNNNNNNNNDEKKTTKKKQ